MFLFSHKYSCICIHSFHTLLFVFSLTSCLMLVLGLSHGHLFGPNSVICCNLCSKHLGRSIIIQQRVHETLIWALNDSEDMVFLIFKKFYILSDMQKKSGWSCTGDLSNVRPSALLVDHQFPLHSITCAIHNTASLFPFKLFWWTECFSPGEGQYYCTNTKQEVLLCETECCHLWAITS